MNKETIESIIKPLINQFTWNAEKGHGSFLTFEFGKPKLKFETPRLQSLYSKPWNDFIKRDVTIHGELHLWIYCCNWNIIIRGKRIVFEESSDKEIEMAMAFLNGQRLISVNINVEKSSTRFKFDLDTELVTYNESYDSGAEMWMLYTGENVLTFNNLGECSFHHENTSPSNQKFEKIEINEIEIKST